MTLTLRSSCLVVSLLAALGLGGCGSNAIPDNRVRLMPLGNGSRMVAVPPECLSWVDATMSPTDNNPWPQYGCASARNLAAQVANSEDLIKLRDSSPADPVITAASVQDYRAGRSKPLIDADAEAPVASMATGSGAAPTP